MWDVLGELIQVVREALADWPKTIRLLSVLAAVIIVLALLR
jgi:hypothetical protein